MPDAETAALLRAVLDEICGSISPFDASTRTNVASRLLEMSRSGRSSVNDLREAGKEVLARCPTMWR